MARYKGGGNSAFGYAKQSALGWTTQLTQKARKVELVRVSNLSYIVHFFHTREFLVY